MKKIISAIGYGCFVTTISTRDLNYFDNQLTSDVYVGSDQKKVGVIFDTASEWSVINYDTEGYKVHNSKTATLQSKDD